jgi:hypothetical protein
MQVNKRFFRSPSFVVAVCVAALVSLAACGGTNEEPPPATDAPPPSPGAAPAQVTPTPSVNPTPIGTAVPQLGLEDDLGPADIMPPPSSPPAQPIPADWATLTGPAGAFTLRYPNEWHHLPDGGIYSWDIDGWANPWFPPGGTKLEVYYGKALGAEPRPQGATDVMLAGEQGWEIVYRWDPPRPDTHVSQVHEAAVEREGFRLSVVAFFTQANPDEELFLQILSTLTFAK